MGRSVSGETKQKLFSYEISLRIAWERMFQEPAPASFVERVREAGSCLSVGERAVAALASPPDGFPVLSQMVPALFRRVLYDFPTSWLFQAFDDSGLIQWLCLSERRCQSQVGKTHPKENTPYHQKHGRAMKWVIHTLPCAGSVRHVTHDEIADAIGENVREILRNTG
jgi:hypothetical protein